MTIIQGYGETTFNWHWLPSKSAWFTEPNAVGTQYRVQKFWNAYTRLNEYDVARYEAETGLFETLITKLPSSRVAMHRAGEDSHRRGVARDQRAEATLLTLSPGADSYKKDVTRVPGKYCIIHKWPKTMGNNLSLMPEIYGTMLEAQTAADHFAQSEIRINAKLAPEHVYSVAMLPSEFYRE